MQHVPGYIFILLATFLGPFFKYFILSSEGMFGGKVENNKDLEYNMLKECDIYI